MQISEFEYKRLLFISACDECKRFLNETPMPFAERTIHRTHTQRFVSRGYWRLCKNVLNNCKSSIHPRLNKFQVFSSNIDKAQCFPQKFTSNSTLEISRVYLPDYHPRIYFLQYDMRTGPSMFSTSNSKQDPHMVWELVGIRALVLIKCAPEMIYVAKHHRKHLSDSSFSACWISLL